MNAISSRISRSFPALALALAGATLAPFGCDVPIGAPGAEDVGEQKSALSAVAAQAGSGILWHLPNGELQVWDMLDGSNFKAFTVASANRNMWTPVATADLNADGAGDILWRSTSLTLSGWLLTDTRYTTSTPETANVPTGPYRTGVLPMDVVANDIDGDKVADLVWKGRGGAPTQTWLIKSGTTTPKSTPATSPWEDEVLLVADFDNDAAHKADVMRRRNSDGMITIEYNQTAASNIEIVGWEWEVRGTGDFNGDQTSDVLWYHPSSGHVHIWYMQPGGKTTVKRASPGFVGLESGWSIAGVGDFNHDNIADMLWRHSSGVAGTWTMDANGNVTAYGSSLTIPAGATFAGIINLGPPTPPTNVLPLPSYTSGGNGQKMTAVRFTLPTQRIADQVEVWEVVNGAPVYRTRLQPTLEFAPNTMRLNVAAATFAAGANACMQLRSWEQGRVSAFTSTFCVGLPPPVASFDWTMPARFGQDWDQDKAVDMIPSFEARKCLKNNLWPVYLDACASNDNAAGGAITSYTWSENGVPITTTRTTCQTHPPVELSAGPHNITVTVKTSDNRTNSTTVTVNVKNTNIVVLGDSMMSGEANPVRIMPAFWGTAQDTACHRANSESARVALALERQDPRSSVTYLSLACTGATIDNIITPGAVQRPNTPGANPVQLLNIGPTLCDGACPGGVVPKIDALVFDGGINDLGFSSIITDCALRNLLDSHLVPHFIVTDTPCGNDPVFKQDMQTKLANLGSKFDQLANAVKGLQAKNVFTGDYPNPAVCKEDGTLCGQFEFTDIRIRGESVYKNGYWESPDIVWMNSFVTGLNNTLRSKYTAAAFGFNFVDYSPAFKGHSYGASDNWFQQYHESWSHQGDDMGTMHPNDYGHVAMGKLLLAKMVAAGIGDANTISHFPSQTFIRDVASTSRYDWGTECRVTSKDGLTTQTMHCCPSGQAMVGLNATNGGLLKCQNITAPLVGTPFLDRNTQRPIGGLNMHACPTNSVMVGFHSSANYFACQALGAVLSGEFSDSGTQDSESAYSIHVCPAGRAMTGVHEDQNRFGCNPQVVAN